MCDLPRAYAGGARRREPLAAIPSALEAVADEHRERWAAVLAADWTPADATESNGAVWPTLGHAVWALRHGSDFAEVMRLMIDLGGDTDTVAAVAGGLGGAMFGMGGIPSRWATVVHGRVPGHGDRVWRVADLQQLAAALDGGALHNYDPGMAPGSARRRCCRASVRPTSTARGTARATSP